MRPVALIIAGPNGSGKSTLIRQLMNDPVFSFPHNYINADDIERELPADGAVTKGERERLHLRRPEDGDNNIVMRVLLTRLKRFSLIPATCLTCSVFETPVIN